MELTKRWFQQKINPNEKALELLPHFNVWMVCFYITKPSFRSRKKVIFLLSVFQMQEDEEKTDLALIIRQFWAHCFVTNPVCLVATGYWNIIVHGRKHSYRLYTKMLNEAMRWANAIQGAIDSKVPIETPTQQLIRDIKVINYSEFLHTCQLDGWHANLRYERDTMLIC